MFCCDWLLLYVHSKALYTSDNETEIILALVYAYFKLILGENILSKH
jgi:hypothetical protein